jgi:hypothetical protein
MRGRKSIACLLPALFLVLPGIVLSQNANHNRTLIINGQTTQVPVVKVNGRSYIGLEALANAVNGSLSYSGSMIALSVPIRSGNGGTASGTNSNAPATAPAEPTQEAPSSAGFSQGFLAAGIEQMSTLREWHTALATAIENGISVTAGLLAPYRAQATTNLRYAMIATTTPADRSAYQLLNNEFQNMAKLSDKYVELRKNLTYVAPDALQNDDLNRRLIACGHALGAMAASGHFSDDTSCH